MSTPAFRRITTAMFFGGFTTFASLYFPQPLLPLFSRDFGVSPATAALSISLTTIAVAAGLIFLGTVSEIFGRKPVMIASILATAVSTLLVSLAQDWTQILILRTLTGLALSGFPAVAMAYLADEMEPRALGLAMGIYIAGGTIGGMLGRFFIAAVADHWQWRPGVAALGAFALIGGLALIFTLPEAKQFRPSKPNARALAISLRDHLQEPGLRLLYAQSFLRTGSFVCAFNFLGYRLSAAPFGLSQTIISAIFLVYLFGTVSSTVAGEISGRIGRRRVLWIAEATMAVGILITWPESLVASGVGIAIFTIGFFAAHSVASSWVGLRAREARAQASALYLFFFYVGSSFAGWLGGHFYAEGGWRGVVVLIGAMSLAAVGIALKLSKVPPPSWMKASP